MASAVSQNSSLRSACALLENYRSESSEDLIEIFNAVIQNQKVLENGVLSLQLKMLVHNDCAYSAQVNYSQSEGSASSIKAFRHEDSFLFERGQIDWDKLDELPLDKRKTLLKRVSNTGVCITFTAKKAGGIFQSFWRRIENNYQRKQSGPPSYLSALIKEQAQPSDEECSFQLEEISQGDHTYQSRVVYFNEERPQREGVSVFSIVQYDKTSVLLEGVKIRWDKLGELPLEEEKTLLKLGCETNSVALLAQRIN